MYVIFSIVMFVAISLIDLPILGPSTLFEVKRKSRQKATKVLFGIEYESNLRVKA